MFKDLIKLIVKILLAAIPLILLLALYVHDDPFKVIYHHNEFYNNGKKEIPLDRDFVSTEIFLNNNPKYKFDSFIFGSSRSLTFSTGEWKKYTSANAFHWDASGETLYGILTKLKFLERSGNPVKNCLMVIDSSTLTVTENREGQLYIKHPLVTQESRFNFQFTFVKTYLSNYFLIPYFFYKFDHKLPHFLDYPGIIEQRIFWYDDVTNDISLKDVDEEIQSSPDAYYAKHSDIFYTRDTLIKKFYPTLIDKIRYDMLLEIKNIFTRCKTDFKIIIYPLYDQKYLNPQDIAKLKAAFGEKNVYDYSGINNITKEVRNYYELNHCRPQVGEMILKEIYRN